MVTPHSPDRWQDILLRNTQVPTITVCGLHQLSAVVSAEALLFFRPTLAAVTCAAAQLLSRLKPVYIAFPIVHSR